MSSSGRPQPRSPGAAAHILVVDDDPDIRTVVRYSLEDAGYEVSTVAGADEAWGWLEHNGLPHLAVVDIMMPVTNGIELCRDIQRYADLPVIMLTAIDQEDTVVQAIEEIAEDYVTKPFNPRILAARVQRVLRRMGDFSNVLAPKIEIDGRLSIDIVHQKVIADGEAGQLTPTETKLLHILVRNRGRTVTSNHLLRRVWPLDEVYEDTLRVHIHRLRHKIEPVPGKPRYLITQRGVGYSFLPAA